MPPATPLPSSRALFDLSGRKFLVVGGARTLGYDMALALAESGADGVVTSRTAPAAVAAAMRLGTATGRAMHGLALNACDESAVRTVVDATVRLLGRIDILITAVGGGGGGSGTASARIEDRPLEAWETIQRTNVTAPFLVAKHVVPVMTAQGAGSIIHVASIAGLVGRDRRIYPAEMTPQSVDYAAAKAAVIGFTTDLAACLGPRGIRVNVISPGGFERGQPRAFVEAYSQRCMLGRMGRDGVDLKGAAVFLASDASAYVTGHNLVVDGGFSVWK
jgi:NAD(P)-dependent dehydrogenase (short-subunit alcohol dehydrogenase family)